MRVVVTGASGNVGTALLRRLGEERDVEVVGVVRRPPEVDRAPYRGVAWVRADLSEHGGTEALTDAFVGADAVVHLAWGFQPSHDLAYLSRLGVGGTARVLAAAVEAGVPHLVHTSSVGAYASRTGTDPVDEGWPTTGIPASAYSRDKVAAERLLDQHERRATTPLISRVRPGLVGQRRAAAELLRYGAPPLLPRAALRAVPVLPLDRGLQVPVVHADDVADALLRLLRTPVAGAFNLAADAPVTTRDVAEALGARHVHVPFAALRRAADLSWRAHLQPLDAGWVALGQEVPLLDCTRARDELGWRPRRTAVQVLEEVVAGMRSGSAGSSPPLRPRSVASEVGALLRRGPVSRRRLP